MKIAEFLQAHSSNYTKGRGGKSIKEMTTHYTATSASAHNNLVYFSRKGANASEHLFVDKDGSIRQSVNFADTAWSVGNFAHNQQSVSVEVVSAGEDFTSAQVNALKEIYQYLNKNYGVKTVIRHYDVTGKRCPAPYIDGNKWAKVKAQIMGGSAVSGGSSNSLGDLRYTGPKMISEWQRQRGTTVDGKLSGQVVYNRDHVLFNVEKGCILIGSDGSILVRSIQKLVGADQDGHFGKETVTKLQKWLKARGYYTGAIDGSYGPQTSTAVGMALLAGAFK